MEVATIILVILIGLLIVVLSGHVIVVNKQSSYPVPVPVPVYKPLIGGCAGTRYGCCPNSTVPKLNPLGTNC